MERVSFKLERCAGQRDRNPHPAMPAFQEAQPATHCRRVGATEHSERLLLLANVLTWRDGNVFRRELRDAEPAGDGEAEDYAAAKGD